MGCCKVLSKAATKAKSIVSGHKKLIMNENSELAASRFKVCKKCPHKVIGICELCGCIIRAKVREETESCPKSKW